MWRKEDVLNQLKEKQGNRSLRAYAAEIGCSTPYLSDVYNGKREPGPKILNSLGIEKSVKVTREVTYHEKKWRKEDE